MSLMRRDILAIGIGQLLSNLHNLLHPMAAGSAQDVVAGMLVLEDGRYPRGFLPGPLGFVWGSN